MKFIVDEDGVPVTLGTPEVIVENVVAVEEDTATESVQPDLVLDGGTISSETSSTVIHITDVLGIVRGGDLKETEIESALL